MIPLRKLLRDRCGSAFACDTLKLAAHSARADSCVAEKAFRGQAKKLFGLA